MEWYSYDIRNMTDDEYTLWYSYADSVKQKRISAFRFQDDKKRSVAGDMLARKYIAEKFSVSPESIEFFTDEYGKPFVKNLPVYFNISHSGNMVVCAFDDKPVGIDIEQIRPVDMKVTRNFFTDDEKRYIFGCMPVEADFCKTENTDILTGFFEIWTAKEACVKYTGKGMEGLNEACDAECHRFRIDDYIITIVTKK